MALDLPLKAILPVAGVGSRLRPHTHTTPKSLVHVAGKPILGHIIDTLLPVGVRELTLVVGHLGSKIVDYVRHTYDVQVNVVEQSEPRGLGHAISLARGFFRPTDPVLIVLGDTIFDADLKEPIARGQSALGLARVADPRKYGVAEVEGDRIIRLVEKPQDPPSDLAIVGVYFLQESQRLFWALDRVIDQEIRTGGEIQLTDALQLMIEQGEDMRYFPMDMWLDCGSPESLLETNRRLLDMKADATLKLDDVIVIPPVYVDPSARVSQSIIGPYVSVSADAVVHRAVVRNTIINQGAHVEDMLLTDSIIGERAAVGGNYARLNVGDSSQLRTVG